MDIPRSLPSKTRRNIAIATGIALFLGILWGASRLKPGPPEVEYQSLLVDTVRRGPMVLEVRGVGTLVPVDVRILTAQVACKVERIHLFPGSAVGEKSLIAELSSPELEQSAQEALWNFRKSESDFNINHLTQKAAVASARGSLRVAEITLKAKERLLREGLESESEVIKARLLHEDAVTRLETEEARLEMYQGKGAVSPARATLEQARAQFFLRRAQMESLKLRAGMEGILQLLPLQVGQQLAPGAILAKVAKPMPLKAELKVNETQAKDVQVGQPARVDTHNGVVEGRVMRVDPAVLNGSVLVDVGLPKDLPKGARPDLSVDGVIEMDRAASVLQVGRPVQAQPNSTWNLFRLSPDGREALRVKVRIGRTSVSEVEIIDGLVDGDKVVISDTSSMDGQDRIRIR